MKDKNNLESLENTNKITRIEVIGKEGKEFTKWLENSFYEIQIQDDGKTIKLFEIENEKAISNDKEEKIIKLFKKIYKLDCSLEDDIIHYSQPCVITEGSWVESEITINEFAYECKEWIFDNYGITVYTGKIKAGWFACYEDTSITFNCNSCGEYSPNYSEIAETEIEAILKIFENLKEHNERH